MVFCGKTAGMPAFVDVMAGGGGLAPGPAATAPFAPMAEPVMAGPATAGGCKDGPDADANGELGGGNPEPFAEDVLIPVPGAAPGAGGFADPDMAGAADRAVTSL